MSDPPYRPPSERQPYDDSRFGPATKPCYEDGVACDCEIARWAWRAGIRWWRCLRCRSEYEDGPLARAEVAYYRALAWETHWWERRNDRDVDGAGRWRRAHRRMLRAWRTWRLPADLATLAHTAELVSRPVARLDFSVAGGLGASQGS